MTGSRKQLPIDAWPAADQRAWEVLFRDGDIFDGRGAGWHWSEATRRTNLKHYARWLGWLKTQGALDDVDDPTERVTPQRVIAYARDLIDEVAAKTADSYLRDLKVVVKTLRPENEWRWLMDLTNRVKAWARPSRDRSPQILRADDVFRRVLAELDQLSGGGFATRREQLAYRDALLVAVLLCGAPRLRNLAMIRVGIHLIKTGPEWHLKFAGRETKNKDPLHLVLPMALTQHIGLYLEHVRPQIPGARGADHLWPACKGKPMAHHTIYDRVCRTTRRLLGIAINPHTFRAIDATLLAESSPADALRARPLLGHRSQATTERYYVKAKQIQASRKVANAIREIRNLT